MKILNPRKQRWLEVGALLLGIVTCGPASALASTAGSVLEELSVPRGATLQIVSYNAVHNGVAQAVATLKSPQSIDAVLDYYRQQWAQVGNPPLPGYIESALPQWRLISRIHNGYSIVVQLNTQQAHHGASGFISVRALDVPVRSLDHGPFDNLDLLSSNRSVDGADTSFLRVYASAQSVTKTHNVYKHRLVKKGWTVLSDTQLNNTGSMVLTREQSRLELTFMASQEYASVLVVHRVTSE